MLRSSPHVCAHADRVTLPSGAGTPQHIAPGADGNMRFTLQNPGAIGRITPDGNVTIYPLAGNSEPVRIALDATHIFDFTDPGTNSVGQISASGDVLEWQLSTPHSGPAGLSTDQNTPGDLFVETGISQIDNVTTSSFLQIVLPANRSSISTGNGVVTRFTDFDPNAVASRFKATISWGDGSTSKGKIKRNAGGVFTVSGKHTYKEYREDYVMSIRVQDSDGSLRVQSVPVDIAGSRT